MTLRYFKGSSAYELQIGKLVFQVPFRAFVAPGMRYNCYNTWLTRNFGLHVWVDPYGSFNILPHGRKPW